MAAHDHDDGACDVAHGDADADPVGDRALLVVYASPLGTHLLTWAVELGFRTALLEPDAARVVPAQRVAADVVHHDPSDVVVHGQLDVVVTDHHREDLGPVLAPLVTAGPRWVGIIGSPRHAGPHGPALASQGVTAAVIDTVRRPIGLDIGSRTPAEIALSILAGLLAERNGRTGGLPAPRRAGRA